MAKVIIPEGQKRKEVWLTTEAISALEAQAAANKRNLKKHMEYVLTKQSEKPVK